VAGLLKRHGVELKDDFRAFLLVFATLVMASEEKSPTSMSQPPALPASIWSVQDDAARNTRASIPVCKFVETRRCVNVQERSIRSHC
jgi:hypothetical protein